MLLVADRLAAPELRDAPARLASALVYQTDRASLSGISGWFPNDSRTRYRLLRAGFVPRTRQPVILFAEPEYDSILNSLLTQEIPLGFSDNV